MRFERRKGACVAVSSIWDGRQIGGTAQTLCPARMRHAERDQGLRPSAASEKQARIKAQEREVTGARDQREPA